MKCSFEGRTFLHSLNDVIQANLIELTEMVHCCDVDGFESPLVHQYAHALYYYLKGETFQCDEVCKGSAESSPLCQFVKDIVKVRIQIRQHKLDRKLLESIQQRGPEFPRWQGEALFVVAMAFWGLAENEVAAKMNSEAYKALEREGAPRKALKAICNKMGCLEKLDPTRNLDVENHFISKRAQELGDPILEGLAHLTLARKYHAAKAYEYTLEKLKDAERCLENDHGAIHFYMAKIHKAFILYALDRKEEAEKVRQEVLICRFKAILSAAETLKHFFDQGISPEVYREEYNSIPNWDEVMSVEKVFDQPKTNSSLKFSKMEQKLVDLISEGPLSRYDIIERLYSNDIDLEAGENRLKNLLNRLKKKYPSLIGRCDGKYTIQSVQVLH
jgi:tetratricopeptide (TPR) repeat protein